MGKPIFLALWLGTIGIQAQTGPLAVKLLTYNLHHGEGEDGRLDLKRISGIISAIRPDYAGLQEIDSMAARTGRVNQAAEYARLTDMEWVFAKAIPLGDGAYGNAALSRFPIGRTVRIPLPGGEPRVALVTDIDLSDGQDPGRSTVTFIDTHLMVGGDAESDRLESARIINAYIRNPANGDTSRPMILLGDMNAGKGSTCIAEFQKQWRSAEFDYGIDWVFFRPANRWRFLRASKPDTGDAAIASDHLPVLQEMELLRPSLTGLLPRTGTVSRGHGAFLLWQGYRTGYRTDEGLGRALQAMDLRGRTVEAYRGTGLKVRRIR